MHKEASNAISDGLSELPSPPSNAWRTLANNFSRVHHLAQSPHELQFLQYSHQSPASHPNCWVPKGVEFRSPSDIEPTEDLHVLCNALRSGACHLLEILWEAARTVWKVQVGMMLDDLGSNTYCLWTSLVEHSR